MQSSTVLPILLKLYLDNVVHIMDDAFDSSTFGQLQVLALFEMSIQTLGARTLRGLTALRELRLVDVKLLRLPGFLFGVSNKIERLEIVGGMDIGDLGSLLKLPLPKLSEMRLRLNAKHFVDSTVLSSVKMLSFLDMQNCGMETIAPFVFFPFRVTLKYINLVGNRLKMLPSTMFGYLLPSDTLKFYLYDNPWDCDCTLVDMWLVVEAHPGNFPGPIACKNSEGVLMDATTSLCLHSEDFDDSSIQCEIPRNIFQLINKSLLTRVVVETDINSNMVRFELTSSEIGYDTLLVFIEMGSSKAKAFGHSCICSSIDQPTKLHYFTIENLTPKQTYLFCVQKSPMSPPRCLTYCHRCLVHSKVVWLTNSVKPTMLLGFVVTMAIVTALSFLVGVFVFRKMQSIGSAKDPKTPDDTPCVVMSDKYSFDRREITTIIFIDFDHLAAYIRKHRWKSAMLTIQ